MPERIQNPPTEWGRYVKSVLDAHGTWTAGQRNRTQIAPATVGSWMNGTPPGPDGVIRFAKGFGEDIAEALRIAGHDPEQYLVGQADYDPRAEALRESASSLADPASDSDPPAIKAVVDVAREVALEAGLDQPRMNRGTGDQPLSPEQLEKFRASVRVALEAATNWDAEEDE